LKLSQPEQQQDAGHRVACYWETADTVPGQPSSVRDFAGIWQLKSATQHDMTVGGADLAGQAIQAGLVDELQLFLVPVVVGGGKRALPHGVRSDLELLDTRRFACGAVYLRYRPSSGRSAGTSDVAQ
jgi:dihydrofolate reductase